MAGYTRQSSSDIVSGEIVEAAPLNAEFNQIQSAFDETLGHSHSGTAGEGPLIATISDADNDTKIHTETSGDEDIIRITIAGTELLQIGANSLRKATGSTVGLGSTTNRFDASFFGSLTTSAATVDVLHVTTGGTANFSGNVLNNVGTSATATDAANVGYVDAKITSANLTGVTTNALVVGTAGTATFNGASTFNGVASFAGNAVTNVGTSATATDAANVGYVNAKITSANLTGVTTNALIVATGGTASLSGSVINNVGTSATVTDAANVGYVNAKITSANLTGVTTNALVVGSGGTTDFNSVRLSEVGTPTVATDAATKGYTDDAIAGQLGGLAGPVSTTDNGLVLWDGTVGGAVQNSPWALDPTTGVMTPGGTDPSITDLVVSDTATFEGLTTTTSAGEYAEEPGFTNATGDVTISATDPTVLRRTLTGDVTLLVAGAETPGYGWSTELRTVQDGTGGRDVTILPANLLTYSGDLQSTAEAGETRPWNDDNTSVSLNAAVGADGQSTLTKLIEDATTSSHSRTRTVSGVSPNQTLTISVEAKDAGDGRSIILQVGDQDAQSNHMRCEFNPATGVAGTPVANGNATGVSATATALPNGSYKFDLTGQPNTSGSNIIVIMRLVSAGNTTYAGDGTSGVYIGDVQVNIGTPVGIAKVGATRAGMVTWRTAADEIDYAAQAAAAESRIIIGVGSDGEILIDDVSLEA